MTYREFIAQVGPSGCRIKLPNGDIITLQEWIRNLRAFHVIDDSMHNCEITLYFPKDCHISKGL